ncbi:uncharacterized protein FIESC28_09610 [Fusarium coffeatum]|uniref:Zn(2)-C6 fungal-type domain-containing protein n=1 Tax=Fusarium coffeatum TaxID=231269 RepID=A0A366QZ99_9HYPO|nr:uncharacterized protein FIESC28_09610 [Fusarium coffeatum]RBR10224.1 hypothetical protein FIESC28_09610 [Fusarium coffeatum]
MDSQQGLPGKGAAYPKQYRRNYPRSRDGCLTCRAKRKKCDKAKPCCNACVRSMQACVWPDDDKKETKTGSNPSPTVPSSEQTGKEVKKPEAKEIESDPAIVDLNFAMVSLSTSSDTQIFRRFLFDWSTPADSTPVYNLAWFAHLPNIYAKASVDSLVHRSFKALANASYGQRFNSSEALNNANECFLTGEAPTVSWSSVNELGLPSLPYFYAHTEHMYQAACLFAEWRTILLERDSDDGFQHLSNIVNRALALDKRYEEWARSLPSTSAYTTQPLSTESQPEWLQPLLDGLWKPLNSHTYPSIMIQVLWRFYWLVRAILNQALLFTNNIFEERQANVNPIFPHRANIETNILSFIDLSCESCLSTLVNITKRIPEHVGAEAVPSLWGYLILQVLPTIGLCLEQVVLPDIDLSGRREWAAKLRHFLRVNFGIAKGATAIPPSHVGKVPIQTWGLPQKLPNCPKQTRNTF